MAFTLNYDDAIHLDAEALAEAGIAEAYERLLPELRQFVKNPAQIEEDRNRAKISYRNWACVESAVNYMIASCRMRLS